MVQFIGSCRKLKGNFEQDGLAGEQFKSKSFCGITFINIFEKSYLSNEKCVCDISRKWFSLAMASVAFYPFLASKIYLMT